MRELLDFETKLALQELQDAKRLSRKKTYGPDRQHPQHANSETRQKPVINTAHHPFVGRIAAPDWASGWGEDEHGIFVEITVDEVTQALRWCPPGRFLMGSPEDEAERLKREGPQTSVTFERGFWLFETPVTQALYKAVTGDTPSHFEGPDRPVERVSWDDAKIFLDRINDHIPGLDLSLPSEAQWEYACRAGSTTPFEPTVARTHAGASITPSEVNYDGNYPYGTAAKGDYRGVTLPVKSRGFRPNAWGLWQMHGNVWEWCEDAWQDSHEGAAPDGSPRPASQPVVESLRVIRGGSWDDSARDCRSAYRGHWRPDFRNYDFGFRPARGQVSGALASSGGARRTRGAA